MTDWRDVVARLRDHQTHMNMMIVEGAIPEGLALLVDASMVIERQAAEIERLRGALSVYADPGFYHGCAFMFDRPTGGFDEDFSLDHGDEDYDYEKPGKLARAALAAGKAEG
jgi:hypothetical protein